MKQIDLLGRAHTVNGKRELPHVHYGFLHNEKGDGVPNDEEKKLIDRVKKLNRIRLNSD